MIWASLLICILNVSMSEFLIIIITVVVYWESSHHRAVLPVRQAHCVTSQLCVFTHTLSWNESSEWTQRNCTVLKIQPCTVHVNLSYTLHFTTLSLCTCVYFSLYFYFVTRAVTSETRFFLHRTKTWQSTLFSPMYWSVIGHELSLVKLTLMTAIILPSFSITASFTVSCKVVAGCHSAKWWWCTDLMGALFVRC